MIQGGKVIQLKSTGLDNKYTQAGRNSIIKRQEKCFEFEQF